MLVVSNLSFEYAENPLLNHLSFSVSQGQLLHVRGPNGAGKSTLLKLLAGLLHPLSGEIFFEGILLHDCVAMYRNQMSYVGHLEGIHPLLTPKEVWKFEMVHIPSTLSLASIAELLQLEDVLDTPFALLSAGQKRRVGMMRLIMKQNAKVWLLDEPWVALDVEGAQRLSSLIITHLKAGGRVVTTSHQPLPLAPSWVSEYVL